MEPAAPHPRYIRLTAIDPARNIARAYEIEWGRDLLGDWIVETRWGRIGCRDRRKVEIFKIEADASARVSHHLRRRASSVKRIGVGYQRAVMTE